MSGMLEPPDIRGRYRHVNNKSWLRCLLHTELCNFVKFNSTQSSRFYRTCREEGGRVLTYLSTCVLGIIKERDFIYSI